MSKISTGVIHRFLTGEIIDADNAPQGGALNPIVEIIRTAINDTDARVDGVYTKAQTDDKFTAITTGTAPDSLVPYLSNNVTLAYGSQTITSKKVSTLRSLFMGGRTLLNLLGRYGNAEVLGRNALNNVTEAADTTNFVYGAQGIKITATAVASEHYAIVGPGLAANSTPVKANTYYVLVAHLRPNVGVAKLRALLFNSSGSVLTDLSSSTITDTTQFSLVYIRIPANANGYAIEARAQIMSANGNVTFTAATTAENLTLDGFRLYEMSYNDYLTFTSLTSDQVAAKYPYVASMRPIDKPYILRFNPFTYELQDYLFFPDLKGGLASSTDGTSYDELSERDGSYFKKSWFKTLDLDGSLPWAYNNTTAGFKLVLAPVSSLKGDPLGLSEIIIKYDGKLLLHSTNASPGAADYSYLDANNVLVSISSADSGWGDAYTPTAAEVQAYFYGWRMYDYTTTGANVANPYNGTGTKAWCYRDPVGGSGSAGWSGGTTVLPIGPAPVPSGADWKPYKLQYKLANSIEEEVPFEGGITLQEGDNIIETGVGMIVRERTVPINDNTKYNINNWTTGFTRLANRVKQYINVYKNSKKDNPWTSVDTTTGQGYGGLIAQTPVANYDAASVYTVTYQALDLFNLSSSFPSFTMNYAANDKTRIDDTINILTSVSTQVSTLQNVKAEKEQPQWIAPTLLNGWVNYGSPNDDAGYYKDSLGIVHVRGLIKSGTSAIDTVLLALPKGYRPSKSARFPLLSATGGTVSIGVFAISASSGAITIDTVALTTPSWVSLDTISFLAEQ